MKVLNISRKKFSKEFAIYLLKYYRNLLRESINNNIDSNMIKYLTSEYHISNLNEFIRALCKSFRVRETKISYDIIVDNNIMYKGHKIYEYCSLIDDGNISVKGTHMISDIVDYIDSKLYTIYNLYIMSGGAL